MPAWAALLGVVAYNYSRHRRGLPTICAVTRRVLPRWAVVLAWAVLTGFMVPHLVRGYARDCIEKELSLCDHELHPER